ncbi:80_t:CDS:2 [Cetraspora pellucida]|uniref:80_t:CDS:1 n=1 Tax=Cetraspora pellucida TaxID=1433469 RepID=A0A9N9CBZ6_9GLOM|nr:80_t:CDS:2 [Cetraspora pellucida]
MATTFEEQLESKSSANATVIPAPIVYIKVVAVKKLVVEYWGSIRGGNQDHCLEKIIMFKAGLCLNTFAWNNKIGRLTFAKTFVKDVFINQERKLEDQRRSDTIETVEVNHVGENQLRGDFECTSSLGRSILDVINDWEGSSFWDRGSQRIPFGLAARFLTRWDVGRDIQVDQDHENDRREPQQYSDSTYNYYRSGGNRNDPSTWSSHELKEWLSDKRISYKGIPEKQELVTLVNVYKSENIYKSINKDNQAARKNYKRLLNINFNTFVKI